MYLVYVNFNVNVNIVPVCFMLIASSPLLPSPPFCSPRPLSPFPSLLSPSPLLSQQEGAGFKSLLATFLYRVGVFSTGPWAFITARPPPDPDSCCMAACWSSATRGFKCQMCLQSRLKLCCCCLCRWDVQQLQNIDANSELTLLSFSSVVCPRL